MICYNQKEGYSHRKEGLMDVIMSPRNPGMVAVMEGMI